MKYREKSGFIFSGISSAQSEYVNLAQKLIFPLRISLVKVNKFAVIRGCAHITK